MNAISVKNLTKTYGSVNAVDNISFSVEKGSLIGFLGVNGAGKSTTINMMSTLLEPNSGNIEICGCDIKKDSRKVREKTGIVYQNNVLDDLLTVKENLLCRGMLRCTDKKQAIARLTELEEIFSLTDILKKKYHTLSGGQKRRCEIAAALMHTPKVLILDEPTTGLDPSARREVWRTIEQLRKKTKMTVFLTTHYMEEAAGADKIIIISKGRIVAEGLPHELKEKYAADYLKIYCDNSQKTELLKNLALNGTKYTDESYGLKISLASTKDALPLLEKAENIFEGFEVIQGTMDDVFLNATKEDIH
ncbi:MAG: ABC transporter ATP-binding protein [Oscillospiraceae bacterium]|nr:ABC transporter ATP-binding protein [Oscillospiraceae bacterium]